MPDAATILESAAKLVTGEREAAHGDKLVCHTKIATLWNAYLGIRRFPADAIGPADVARMMALLKVARSQCGEHNNDDAVDGAAYLAIAGELEQ